MWKFNFFAFKSDQDPDPHWFGSLELDPDLDLQLNHEPIHNTEYNSPSHHRPKIRHRSRRGKDWAWLTRTDQNHRGFLGR